jgi:predicted PurR-regulated permease PerM
MSHPENNTPKRELTISTATTVKTVLAAAATLVLVRELMDMAYIFLWIALALFLALVLDPWVHRLQDRGLSHTLSVLTTVGTVVVFIGLASFFFIQPLAAQGDALLDTSRDIVYEMQQSDRLKAWDREYQIVERVADGVESSLQRVPEYTGKILGAVLYTFFGSITVIVLASMFLLTGPRLVHDALILWPALAEDKRWRVLASVYDNISRYISGTLLVALIAGVYGYIVLSLLGIPYALPLALWIMLFAVVPTFGAMIGTAPALIVGLFISPWVALGVFVAFLAYQQVESMFLTPRIVGSVIRMPALFVFLAGLVGYGLAGVIGVLMATPLVATVQALVGEAVALRKQQNPEVAEIAEDRASRKPRRRKDDLPDNDPPPPQKD